jgi:hypothetical protein
LGLLLFNARARVSWLRLILRCRSSIRLENLPNAVFLQFVVN